MNAQWKEFLITQSATLSGNRVIVFGSRTDKVQANNHKNLLTDLSFFSLLSVTGKDAVEFLHGQFTSDIRSLADNTLQFTAWCNAKGQVVNTLYLFKQGDNVQVILPESVSNTFIKRLQMYIMRADIHIEKNEHKLICGIMLGDDKYQIIQKISDKPIVTGGVFTGNNITYIHLLTPHERYILLAEVDDMVGFWEKHLDDLTRIGCMQWEEKDIRSGLPWITEKTTEEFLPQYLGLDHFNAISLDKGCYPGQEVIARLHYRGRVKQDIYLVETDHITHAEPGTLLYTSSRDTSIGKIINISETASSNEIALAVINKEYFHGNNIYLDNNSDTPVRVKSITTC